LKILIIGGSKFLGYHLTHSLIGNDFHVTLFNRGQTEDNFGDSVERIKGDRKDYNRFYDLFHRKTFDAVIDLIAYDLEDVEVSERTFRNNIGQYLFMSTGQVYLVTKNKNLPASEEDFFQDIIPCPPGENSAYEYGIRKRKIEIFLKEQYSFRKFPAISLRCPIIHGPKDYTLRLYSYLLRIQDGNRLIIPQGGDSIIRHIYVGDVIQAILRVLSNPTIRGEAFNLAQKEVLTLSEFIGVIGVLMNSQVQTVEIPLLELSEHQLPADISPFSGRWVSYLNPDRAESELDFHSTPMEEWLPGVFDFFFNKYNGPEPENYQNRDREIQLLKKLNNLSDRGF
jgi:nucleoside-diphosphate-sugar epimerase